MKTSLPRQTAILLIDVQLGFDHPQWGRRNNPAAEANCARLLNAWRNADRPVYHVKHNSQNPRSPLHPAHASNARKPVVVPRPGGLVISKNVSSRFISTNLEAQLRAAKISDFVSAGLTTPHGVSPTARMAGNLGFSTSVVADATAAFEWPAHDGKDIPPEEVHYHALATLQGEFAAGVTTAAVLGAI